MYLLDTNIISALLAGPTPSNEEIRIRDRLQETSHSLFISAISIAEIESGIAKSERQGALRKADQLTSWLNSIIHMYADRILPFDLASARLAGRLLDKAYGKGGLPDFEDAAIAAIAHSNQLQVLTRNARHFQFFEVSYLNPYDQAP